MTTAPNLKLCLYPRALDKWEQPAFVTARALVDDTVRIRLAPCQGALAWNLGAQLPQTIGLLKFQSLGTR